MDARAGNRRFEPFSTLRAHTSPPGKTDLLWETRRAHDRPGRAWTVLPPAKPLQAVLRRLPSPRILAPRRPPVGRLPRGRA